MSATDKSAAPLRGFHSGPYSRPELKTVSVQVLITLVKGD
jgi:hypothetical protein